MTKKNIRTLFIIAVIAIAVLGFVGWKEYSSYKPVSYVIDGEDFSASVVNGGELILDLPSNPTTGYTWVITEEPDIFASDYDTYSDTAGDSGLLGAGGISEFHIIALGDGTGTMVFQYKRPWDGGDIAGTYELTLEISRHNKSYLQIDSVSFVQVG